MMSLSRVMESTLPGFAMMYLWEPILRAENNQNLKSVSDIRYSEKCG
jgi:hypothetical protein